MPRRHSAATPPRDWEIHHEPQRSLIAAKATLGASLALGLLLTPHATAHADDVDAYEDDGIIHVNLSELPGHRLQCRSVWKRTVAISTPALLPCIWNGAE